MAERAKRDDPPVPEPGIRLSGESLGIDVGGTGVKAALVDLATGELSSERIREKTPHPATPDAVAATIATVVGRVLEGRDVTATLPAGCGLPGVIKDGRLMTAANIDSGWLEVSAEEVIGAAIGRPVLAINDADAAGIAEMTYGAGAGHLGTVLLLTIGTGIGTALFIDGRLVPNMELGHVEMRGKDAETLVSGASRERRGLGWKRWAREFDEYLDRMERYFWPDLIILGGGVSKDLARYEKWLTTRAPIRPAVHLNASGIIGAAFAAAAAVATPGGPSVDTAVATKPGRGRSTATKRAAPRPRATPRARTTAARATPEVAAPAATGRAKRAKPKPVPPQA
ncbi:MAG: ROK family protein [Chloroflexi bacterium]|nr:ROK family protein [Chloroflexota bacterium]